MLQLILSFNFAFISRIPTLSSNKSFSVIGLQSTEISVIFSETMDSNKDFVISSFPEYPNVLLKT